MIITKRWSKLREIFLPFRWAFVKYTCFILATQAVASVPPFFYGKVVDGLHKKESINVLLLLAVAMAFFHLAKNYLEWKREDFKEEKLDYDLEERICDVTLTNVMRLSLGQILNHNSGFKHDIIKKGETSLTSMVDMIFGHVIPDFVKMTIAAIGLFWLNPILGLVTFSCVFLFVFSSYLINKRMVDGIKKLSRMDNYLGTWYWEIIKHLRLVIVNNQEKRAVREFIDKFREYGDAGKKLWIHYHRKCAYLRDPIIALGQFAVICVGIYLVSSGEISAGVLVTTIAWSMSAFQSMMSVGPIQRNFAKYSVAIDRYLELLEIPPAVTQVKNPIRPKKFNGRIEFKNVSFEYPRFKGRNLEVDGERILSPDESGQAVENISFTIEPGTTCALVGHSGAGKSTIINLLLRGYDPEKGEIRIDGNDLRLLDIGDWRKSVGVVEQEAKLWDGTLRYNIVYGLNGHGKDVTENQLEDLARRTRINEFYDRLGKERFETEIGENGIQLSGGQRQRVAIARAIAKSPSVLIFDEATNALDPVNERAIHQAINEALVGRTGIIIAHRLSTIRHADQILVFEKGRIVGNGKHEELMVSCPTYQAMVDREIGTLLAS